MNALWLLLIIPLSMVVGFTLCFWFVINQIKKATGIKNWKQFVEETKKAKKIHEKMEREGLVGIMSDPRMMKQIEEMRKRFEKKS